MLQSKALDITEAKIYFRIDEDAEDSLIEFLLELQDTLKVDLMAHAMTKNKISNLNDVIEIVNSLDEKV